jgi:hypothetical protein
MSDGIATAENRDSYANVQESIFQSYPVTRCFGPRSKLADRAYAARCVLFLSLVATR